MGVEFACAGGTMNLVSFALRRPISLLMMVIAVAFVGFLAVDRMSRDIFPDLGVPVLYVAQPYGGMDPAQMEGFIINYYEYHFLYITGIEHVESQIIQGVALIKLQFHPGTEHGPGDGGDGLLRQPRPRLHAAGNRAAVRDALRRRQRAGRQPGLLQRRPRRSAETAGRGAVPGAPAVRDPAGRLRPAAVRRQPAHHRRQRRSRPAARLQHVARTRWCSALSAGNTISPSGNVRIGDLMPMVPINSVVRDIKDLEDVPIRIGRNADRLRPRRRHRSKTAPTSQTGYALVNGRRTVYIPVTKRADASTLAVVNLVKAEPAEVPVASCRTTSRSATSSTSRPTSRAPSGACATKALLGAVLTGLMVLLFLRDWRSALVVVLNIPLALLAAAAGALGDGPDGQPHDAGRPGAGGRHPRGRGDRHHREHPHPSRARHSRAAGRARRHRRDDACRACWRCCASWPCSSPPSSCRGRRSPVRAAVPGGRVLDGRVVPAFQHACAGAVGLAAAQRQARRTPARQEALIRPVSRQVRTVSPELVMHRRLGRRAVSTWPSRHSSSFWSVRALGTEIFPVVDAGQFHCACARQPARGSRTEQIACRRSTSIKREVGPENVEISSASSACRRQLSRSTSSTSGPAAPRRPCCRCSSSTARASGVEGLEGTAAPQAAAGAAGRAVLLRAQRHRQPGDELRRADADRGRGQRARTSPTTASTPRSCERRWRRFRRCATSQFGQALDYPAVKVNIDRERAGVLGVTADDVARRSSRATSSSRFTAANFWADPKSGIGYQVQVQIPIAADELARGGQEYPDRPASSGATGHAAQRRRASRDGTALGEYDRYNMQRMLTLSANIAGEDLGRSRSPGRNRRSATPANAAREGERRPSAGRSRRWSEMFGGLQPGLLLSRWSSSSCCWRRISNRSGSPWRSCSTVPAVIAGVAVALWLTRHDAQHPILHGRDHGDRRGGRERDPAGHLRRAQPGGGPRAGEAAVEGAREPPAADPHDQSAR